MFTDKQLGNYADVLLWGLETSRTGPYQKNDIVLINYNLPAVKLAEIVHEKLIERGMNPIRETGMTPKMEKDFYKKSNDDQLVFQPPGREELYHQLNGAIYLHAPESITHLGDVDPANISKAIVARKVLRDILTKREETGRFGWTLCVYPTPELAKQAKLSVEDYTAQITKACFLNEKSAVGKWKSIFEEAISIKEWLNAMDVEKYHIESDNIDLEITPGKDRKWIGISGHNIPSFELFISPDWRGTRGKYFANQPSYRSGNYVENVRLTFEEGEAIRIEAQKGEKFVKQQLATDAGANKVGEFSLTDKRFSNIDKFMANTLFDENFGGTYGNCHIAMGSAYSDAYAGDPGDLTETLKKDLGFNDSAMHWDLVNTENKKVTAYLSSGDRMTIYEDGVFTY